MELELRHLRAICAIADAGSLSRAAVRLGVTQPALTMLLARVEEAVGGRLFVRDRAGARPTDLGDNALRQARLLLADLDTFAADLAARSVGARPPRVASAHLACLSRIVDVLEEHFPSGDLTVQVESSTLVLCNLLERAQADLAIIGQLDNQELPLSADIHRRTIIPKFPIFVALSHAHPLAARPEIALEDLADERWICPPGADDGSLAALRAMCRKAGFTPKIRFHVPSGGGTDLIAAGHAIRLVDPGSNPATCAIRPLKNDPSTGRLLLAWHRQSFPEDTIRTLCHNLAQAYTTHAQESPTYAHWWQSHPEAHPWTP
ncbi:LysR family transcriptional regulator [Saccharothrix variisporea]|uniref:DNA-binding transcriptional LysR family regulator n=1 Tax=Saccharothrix variisporea TaxID=543527 RepID=A0A495X511_9PSEU|nr:LysR family transcriptional regulator [Saccharothrix variisporea]RKT68609.1 DNA-binding transcriptional LysR family regulator [Saccharothrix variisporea]